jgi:hypothetical protein
MKAVNSIQPGGGFESPKRDHNSQNMYSGRIAMTYSFLASIVKSSPISIAMTMDTFVCSSSFYR